VYWEVAEVIAMSMFMALYLTLMYKGTFPYFHIVGQSLYALLIICIYPYVIFNLSIAYMAQKEEQATYDDSLMRFVDNTQRVKLMIASSAVLYIKAEENYVHIRYMEGERLKEYALRASMKSLEELMHKHGLIRCQRSYYVNPQHIKVLRRDKEGMITAELNTPQAQTIPVSPRYYEELAKWL
jgi:DNA-binding LytR/AlgR family response regulator